VDFVFFFFRKQVTSRSNNDGIILRLETVGDAGDAIDLELEKGTRLPGNISSFYLPGNHIGMYILTEGSFHIYQ
jgi:hypothetical protein